MDVDIKESCRNLHPSTAVSAFILQCLPAWYRVVHPALVVLWTHRHLEGLNRAVKASPVLEEGKTQLWLLQGDAQDSQGIRGIHLQRNVVDIAQKALKANLMALGPLVLPVTELVSPPLSLMRWKYGYNGESSP